MHKILWVFEIQTNHLIQAEDWVKFLLTVKNNLSYVPANQSEWKKYPDLPRELKK